MSNAAQFTPPIATGVAWRNAIVAAWLLLWIVVYALMGLPKIPLEVGLVMLLYFAVATPVRAVPGWMLLTLFGIGNVVVPWVTVALQILIQKITTNDAAFLSGVIAPVTEEIMKMLPVVVLYFWRRPRLRVSFGATDWMLCGMASGSGVQIWEDVLIRWQRSFPPSVPSVFGIPLVSGFTDNGRAVFIGHVAATAMIALALGWVRYVKPPRPAASTGAWISFRASRLFAYTPALAALIWMMVDHAGNNLRNERAWHWIAANAIYYVGGRGRLAVYVFLAAVIATILFEAIVLARAPKVSAKGNYLRRLIRSHQMKYAWLAGVQSDESPGWNLRGFLRRSRHPEPR